MSVIKESIDTQITINPGTTIQSLANGAYWQTAPVDWTSNLAGEALVQVLITSGAGAPTAGSTVTIYVYGSVDGTHYPDTLAAAEGTFVPTAEGVLKQIGLVIFPATINLGLWSEPFPVSQAFGAMPKRWGVCLHNTLGAALNATAANFQILISPISATVL